jgi:hypothetical protein
MLPTILTDVFEKISSTKKLLDEIRRSHTGMDTDQFFSSFDQAVKQGDHVRAFAISIFNCQRIHCLGGGIDANVTSYEALLGFTESYVWLLSQSVAENDVLRELVQFSGKSCSDFTASQIVAAFRFLRAFVNMPACVVGGEMTEHLCGLQVKHFCLIVFCCSKMGKYWIARLYQNCIDYLSADVHNPLSAWYRIQAAISLSKQSLSHHFLHEFSDSLAILADAKKYVADCFPANGCGPMTTAIDELADKIRKAKYDSREIQFLGVRKSIKKERKRRITWRSEAKDKFGLQETDLFTPGECRVWHTQRLRRFAYLYNQSEELCLAFYLRLSKTGVPKNRQERPQVSQPAKDLQVFCSNKSSFSKMIPHDENFVEFKAHARSIARIIENAPVKGGERGNFVVKSKPLPNFEDSNDASHILFDTSQISSNSNTIERLKSKRILFRFAQAQVRPIELTTDLSMVKTDDAFLGFFLAVQNHVGLKVELPATVDAEPSAI